MTIKVESLHYGGIIVCYQCSAACRHCLYACSPTRTSKYMDVETLRNICAILRKKGCKEVHVGGGEPFTSPEKLIDIVKTIISEGITVRFIETNASWISDNSTEILKELKKVGITSLCISVDPFHVEYVPFEKTLKLAKLCEDVGINFEFWQKGFIKTLSELDKSKVYSRAELEESLSPNYLKNIARAYGKKFRYIGRAINIEMEYYPRQPVDDLIKNQPCSQLISGDHFHVDLYGDFISSFNCTGIRTPIAEITTGLSCGKYPVFEALYEKGTYGLLGYAKSKGFIPDADGYTSTCALCFHVCKWLSTHAPSPELDKEYYTAALEYYD